ncbi:hypothetical protein MUK42_05074 [Musa troglodytarum]|uniref:RING-type domain-containing protein n=1 Tax=Musa troglodytarum TaxID=320322 RepID=A0A9E7GMG2_9LILI|nr:hypothetical protein MUK42_05074 [Musa troglodytarum]
MGKRSGGQLRSVSLFLALVSMTNCEQLLTISGAAARPSSSHTTKPPPTPVSSRPTPSTPARPPPTLAASPLAAGAVDARSPPHCPHTQSFLRRASPLPSAESPRVPPPQASCLPFLAMLERDLLKPLPPAMPPAFGQLPTLVGAVEVKPNPRTTTLEFVPSTIIEKEVRQDINIILYNIIGVIVLFFKRSTNQDLEESQRHGPIRQDVQEIEMFSVVSYSTSESHSLIEDVDNCLICLEEFTHRETIIRLSCHHIFHVACINKWFTVRTVCPLCVRDYHTIMVMIVGSQFYNLFGVIALKLLLKIIVCLSEDHDKPKDDLNRSKHGQKGNILSLILNSNF